MMPQRFVALMRLNARTPTFITKIARKRLMAIFVHCAVSLSSMHTTQADTSTYAYRNLIRLCLFLTRTIAFCNQTLDFHVLLCRCVYIEIFSARVFIFLGITFILQSLDSIWISYSLHKVIVP